MAELEAVFAETFAMLRMGRRVLSGEAQWVHEDEDDPPVVPSDQDLAHSLAEQADWLGGILLRTGGAWELVEEAEALLDFFRAAEDA